MPFWHTRTPTFGVSRSGIHVIIYKFIFILFLTFCTHGVESDGWPEWLIVRSVGVYVPRYGYRHSRTCTYAYTRMYVRACACVYAYAYAPERARAGAYARMPVYPVTPRGYGGVGRRPGAGPCGGRGAIFLKNFGPLGRFFRPNGRKKPAILIYIYSLY